ncbi:MAG TPA: N-acetylmuramoyl-L-alanine amidase [Xanthobacteraceae bacterium]|jgi:N-acetylmuramoyl-L-alanine amidase|nr:N-acetylmuramoyl-L-alanine amidase [Xanthobacteraceae bacterium]
MSVRAAISVFLFGATVLGGASAAERTGASGSRIGATADFPVASDVRLGGDDTQTRLIVDLSRKIDIRTFTLANPYRVVMDMPQVAFQFPAQAGEMGRGLIKAFRFGLVMQGGSRMVIDLARPAQVDMAFVLDPINDQPARLVLHLTATDRDSFMRNLALDSGAPQRSKPDAPVEIKPNGDSRPLIVIDPGHGGIDNGTRAASGEMEKTIVLEFSLRLRDKIEKTGKYRVLMTRTDDTFVALRERVQFARTRQAALFISIHADALRRREGDAQGATVYTLSERASDARAARLAEVENRADVIAGLDLSTEEKDVADILVDLARRETKTFSMQFAQTVVGTLRSAARLHQHPLKSASFVVLKAPDVPSVLVELGYVSNKADLKALISAEWREHTADAIIRAVDAFLSPRLAGNGQGSGQN